MATQVESDPQAGMAPLVSGIIHDARQLFIQQLTLFQVELRNDVRRCIAAAIPLFLGVVIALVALVTLAIAGALLICWLWPELAWCAGFAIMGASLAAIGGGLILWGKAQFASFNPLPEKSVEGLKENLQWKTKK
jgi:uncharacterized membrane protein YqjE